MARSKTYYSTGMMFNETYNVTSTFNRAENVTKPQRQEDLAKVEIAVLSAIFALAIIGNCCVLVVLGRRRKKSRRMHIFIMHLSIADLLVAFFNVLPQLIWDITHRWHGGDFLCRFIKYSQIFVMYLSTYILVMTAIDRYRAICHPLSNHTWTPRLVHIMIAGAYVIAAVMSLPQIIIFKYQETEPGSGIMDCWAEFDPPWTMHLYINSFTVLVYIIPFVILVACYGSICYTIWRKYRLSKDSMKCIARDQATNEQTQMQSAVSHHGKHVRNHVSIVPRNHAFGGFSKAKMKTVKLTFVIILAYLVCWSPFFVSQLWWLYDKSASSNSAVVIMLLLTSLNSCCNPWIYLAFSGNMMKSMSPCKCSKMEVTTSHVEKLCMCACSDRKEKKHGPKRKWTFRSGDSFDTTQSVKLTTCRKEERAIKSGEIICNTKAEYIELNGIHHQVS